MEVLGLYDVVRMARHDPVLCLLAVCRSKEIDGSRYGGNNMQFFEYKFKAGLVYGILLIRTIKRPKLSSDVVVDIPCHEVCYLQDSQLASITSCEAK